MQKSHIYQGLGFPVILTNVPMVQVRGVWIPEVRLGRLQEQVALSLALSSSPLQGVHIAFIRKWLDLTLDEFGQVFGPDCDHFHPLCRLLLAIYFASLLAHDSGHGPRRDFDALLIEDTP